MKQKLTKSLTISIFNLIIFNNASIAAEYNVELDQASTSVRDSIPETPALDGIYPPMSANGGPRWEYIKNQYNQWYYKQAPSYNNGIRGDGNGEAWRYDPMKTLVELCRRANLVGDDIPEVCEDAKDTIAEFFSLQHWGTKGEYPDCSGGITGITRGNGQVNKCDFKYGGHASASHYATELYGQTPYSNEQTTMFKEYCFNMGWNGQNFTERNWGLSLQCLIDLQKQDVDTSNERKYLIDNLYSLVMAGKVGAPIHGINTHEGTTFPSDPQMFSPWMGSSFLIPALWEYWVFIEKDPVIADMIVKFGDALMNYGVVDPKKWAPDEQWHWKTKENPTQWLTLYFSIPDDKAFNIERQNSDGGYSDLHNPESIFALNAAYFFSCNPSFKERSTAMNPYFNDTSAAKHIDAVNRVFLWQHRGSASTEWLLENANCGNADNNAPSAPTSTQEEDTEEVPSDPVSTQNEDTEAPSGPILTLSTDTNSPTDPSVSGSETYQIEGIAGQYFSFNMADANDKKCKQGFPDYPKVTGLPEGVYRSGCSIYGSPSSTGVSHLTFPIEGGVWTADLIITSKNAPEAPEAPENSIPDTTTNPNIPNSAPIQGTVGKYFSYNLEQSTDQICRKGFPDYPKVTGLPAGVYRSGCIIYGKPENSGTSLLTFPVTGGEWIVDLAISE